MERYPVSKGRTVIASLLSYVTGVNWLRTASKLGRAGDALEVLSSGCYAPEIRTRLSMKDIDIIHTSAIPHVTNLFGAQASERSGKPLVITPLVNAALGLESLADWTWRVLAKCTAIVAVTTWEASMLIGRGIPRDKIHVIPAGIDLTEWTSRDGRKLRANLELEGKFVVLIAKRSRDKGCLDVLDALLSVENKIGALAVIILGEGEFPRYKNRIARLRKLGVKVLELGYVDETAKRDIFDACDVLAQPSRAEAFGLVYLEAWACFKPIIASRFGAVEEVVKHGVNGMTVQHGNVQEIAGALRTLYENRTYGRDLGRSGFETLTHKYDIKKVAKQIASLYDDLV